MKIMLSAGGTGGHFYPSIAVAEAIRDLAKERRLVDPKLYYAAPEPYDERMLFENDIEYVQVSAGKMRRYASILNVFDSIKTAWGILVSVIKVFFIFPDVVFGKGGYGSFPTLVAARLFRIPVVIHESDSVPGRVNRWASKFARKIAISYPEAAGHFPKEKTALTGNPVRKALLETVPEGAGEYLHLEQGVPVILILGGSQGAQAINNAVLGALPELVERYQVIHQTGTGNFDEVSKTASIALEKNPNKERYKPFAYLNDLAMRMSAGAASLVVSRAGSAIFEIAIWGLPSIIVPIPEEVVRDQTTNAFSYARSGAATVVEQRNLTPHLLVSEINRILDSKETVERMREATKTFAKRDAARTIAEGILEIALGHETR